MTEENYAKFKRRCEIDNITISKFFRHFMYKYINGDVDILEEVYDTISKDEIVDEIVDLEEFEWKEEELDTLFRNLK